MNLRCKSAWVHYKVGVSRDEMPDSSSGITGSEFPEWRFPSYWNTHFFAHILHFHRFYICI